jgi:hypothetical protein
MFALLRDANMAPGNGQKPLIGEMQRERPDRMKACSL